MRKTELSRFRRQLEAQLAHAAQHGAAAAHDLATTVSEELPDPSDRATRVADLESELRLADRDRQLVDRAREALQRLEAGQFGLCTSCGGEIGLARLRARPETSLCIDCQREQERARGG
jgi:DnaK suppressor protein